MRKLGVGILGNGMATRVFHAPLIGAAPQLELRAIHARSAGAVSPVAGVPLVQDMEALLADPDIGLITVATPSATHAQLAERALLAGKHVVVEKPFALELAQAQALVALARGRGLCLAAFHNRRWDSDFMAVRAAIEAGVIGQVVHFESHFDRFRPQVRDRWREDGGAGSGVWFDLGPHMVDQALVLFGMPLAVSADMGALRPEAKGVDWAHVVLRYADKRVILHAGLCVAGGVPRFAVHGTGGSLVKQLADPQEAQSVAGLTPQDAAWGVDEDPLLHYTGEGAPLELPVPRGCQQSFYQRMAQACLGEGEAPNAPEEILGVQAIIEAAILSADEGRVVPL
jgi:predicted dehydrogenase